MEEIATITTNSGSTSDNHMDPAFEKELGEMLNAGVHFGYSRTRRHPKMKPYIFGVRNNVEVFDLEKVRSKLIEAEDFLKNLGQAHKKILFVGTKPGINDVLEKAVQNLGMPYASVRWIGGALTNFKVIKARMSYFEDLIVKREKGELAKYTKKEQLKIGKEIAKFENSFRGLRLLKELPEAVVIIDPKEEKTALQEARRLKIPIISILNTDCDPTDISYFIPANDASISSVKYLLERLIKAYEEGSKKINEPGKGN